MPNYQVTAFGNTQAQLAGSAAGGTGAPDVCPYRGTATPTVSESNPCTVPGACSIGRYTPSSVPDDFDLTTSAQELQEAFPYLNAHDARCWVLWCASAHETKGKPYEAEFEAECQDFEYKTWSQDKVDACLASLGVDTGGTDPGNAVVEMAPLASEGGPAPSQMPLTYNVARSSEASDFGMGWSYGFGSRVLSEGGGYVIVSRRGEKSAVYTGSPGVGSFYAAPAGASVSLRRLASGWEELLPDGSTRTYDGNGRLSTVTTAVGTWTMTRDGGSSQLLTKVTSPTGAVTTLSYTSGKLSSIEDPAGRETLFQVDGSGNLVKMTSPELCVTSFVYDGSHRLIAWVSPMGVVTSLEYDSQDRLTAIDEPTGVGATYHRTTFTYSGSSLGVCNPRGGATTYTRDGDNRPWLIQRPDGGVTTQTWLYGLLRSRTTPDGQTVSYTYQNSNVDATIGSRRRSVQHPTGRRVTYHLDGNDCIEGFEKADGNRTTFTWSGGRVTCYQNSRDECTNYTYTGQYGQVATSVHADGQVTTYHYDSGGLLEAVQSATGRRTTYTYNAAGWRIVTQHATGQRTTLVRDDVNRILAKVAPSGERTSFIYQAGNCQLVSRVEPWGAYTTYTYDGRGRRRTKTTADGCCTTYQHDSAGNLIAKTNARGYCQTLSYDLHNRPIAVMDATGVCTTTAYRVTGVKDCLVHPDGLVTTFVYDNYNRYCATAAPTGTRTTVQYDALGHICGKLSTASTVTTLAYDTLGRQNAVTAPTGGEETTIYSVTGRVSAVVDALGYRTTSTYNGAGQLISVTNALGQIVTTTYNAAGQVAAQMNPLGQCTSFHYDVYGRQVAQESALGYRTTTVYDSSGRPHATMDAEGYRSTSIYDVMGRVVAQENPLGYRATTVYDQVGNPIAQIDPLGYRTTTAYDKANRVVSVTNPLGEVATQVYSTTGRLAAQIDSLGHITTIVYDGTQRRIGAVNGLGYRVTTVYDVAGRPIAIVNPLGLRTTTTFDSFGRTSATITPLGRITTSSYDLTNRIISEHDSSGRAVTTVYDPLGRVSSTVDNLGSVVTWLYDAAGHPIARINPLGYRTTNVFDTAGRNVATVSAIGDRVTQIFTSRSLLSATQNPLNYRTTYGYDAAEQRVSVQNPRGYITTNYYDAVGRKTGVLDANGGRATTQYDAAGQVRLLQNPNGGRRTLTFAHGQLRSEMDPLGRIVTLTYTALGQVASKQDARGVIVSYSYDGAGRNVLRTYTHDVPITLQYDSEGHLASAQDATGSTSFLYLASQPSDAPFTTFSGTGHGVTFTYDAVGRRRTMYATNRMFTYQWDAVGQLACLIAPEGRTTYTYDAVGRVASLQLANGTKATQAYDVAGRLVGKTHRKSDATLLKDFRYVYDAGDNPYLLFENGGLRNLWNHDILNRVSYETRLVDHVYADIFTYDSNGNRIAKSRAGAITTFTYDIADELLTCMTSGGTTTYSYDAAGNQILEVGPAGQRTTSSWNDNNHRTRVETASGDDIQAKYGYDGLRREMVDTSGAIRRFVFDGQNYLLETAGATNEIDVSYTVEPHSYGDLLSKTDASGSLYYHGDALGSTRFLTDFTQTQQDSYLYDAWGNTVAATGSSVNPFRWVGALGYYYDEEVGNYYIRARHYSPVVARWMSQDPLFWPSFAPSTGRNLFEYVDGGAVSFTDPSGLLRGSTGIVHHYFYDSQFASIEYLRFSDSHLVVKIKGRFLDYGYVAADLYARGPKKKPRLATEDEAKWVLHLPYRCMCGEKGETLIRTAFDTFTQAVVVDWSTGAINGNLPFLITPTIGYSGSYRINLGLPQSDLVDDANPACIRHDATLTARWLYHWTLSLGGGIFGAAISFTPDKGAIEGYRVLTKQEFKFSVRCCKTGNDKFDVRGRTVSIDGKYGPWPDYQ